MNWPIIIIAGIIILILLAFLVRRNWKDKEDLETKIRNDYPKPLNDKGDIEVDEKMK